MAVVFIALVHHPVYNKNREVIASALTTIDMHDLARLTATYGLAGFYVVTPLGDQLKVAGEMLHHWRQGWGAAYNRDRAEALDRVWLAESVQEALDEATRQCGTRPELVATSAQDNEDCSSFQDLRDRLKDDRPVMILFGTAWGLTDEVLAGCDVLLESVKGPTNYNHLSVRSAAGIILDRLLGRVAVGG